MPPARRALDVLSPVVVYRVLGRRPSQVYVDGAMQPSHSGAPAQRLKDTVYWEARALPGDQIQERPGSIMLMTALGRCHRVRLAPPVALDVQNAFTHAERAVQRDCEIIDSLLTEGVLARGVYRRPHGAPLQDGNRALAEDHPLIADSAPDLSLADAAPPAQRSKRWARGSLGR